MELGKNQEIWAGSNLTGLDHLSEATRVALMQFVESAWGEPEPGKVQAEENYDAVIVDDEWKTDLELLRCPDWLSAILKSIPLSGLYFEAPVPDDEFDEEHLFLPLSGWPSVAEDYPFFVPEFLKRGDYPIASSGYGYLVVKANGSAEDPIDRWDGSAMEVQTAFESFGELVRSMKSFSDD